MGISIFGVYIATMELRRRYLAFVSKRSVVLRYHKKTQVK